MRARVETSSPITTDIVTGHFRRKRGYYAWRPRGTKDWLLIYTVSGQGRFGYVNTDGSNGQIISRPGDMIALRPGTLHDYGVEPELQQWELLWAHFHPRPQWHALLNWPQASSGARGLMRLQLSSRNLRARIHHRLKDVHRWAGGVARQRIEFAFNALEEVLLWCDTVNLHGKTPLDPRIEQAMDQACADLSQPISIPAMANVAGLSASRFAHLFRQSLGISPRHWIELQRINRARQLLELTDLPIKQIAADVGFESPFYFSLRFTHYHGKSPRRYRADITRQTVA